MIFPTSSLRITIPTMLVEIIESVPFSTWKYREVDLLSERIKSLLNFYEKVLAKPEIELRTFCMGIHHHINCSTVIWWKGLKKSNINSTIFAYLNIEFFKKLDCFATTQYKKNSRDLLLESNSVITITVKQTHGYSEQL